MRKSFRHILHFLLLAFTVSCIETIPPEQLNFEDLLVVEGIITDTPIRQEITLSRTFPLTDSVEFNPEQGAQVSMIDQNGATIPFVEVEPGRYLTESTYSATLDGSLQLFITTASGMEYESSEVKVLRTPPVDSIYAEFTPEPVQRNIFAGRFNFFLDANSNAEENRYYRWKWNSTYEFSLRRPSRWLFIDNEFIIRERGSENDSLQVEVCWIINNSNNLNIAELLVPSTGIERFPILDFHSETGFMKRGFSLEVKQYAISQESYSFWNLIQETNEESGSLSDTQPGTISGNIRSLSNPNEIVLGYFEAAQERAVRRQFSRQEFFDDGFRVVRADLIECFGVDSVVSAKTPEAVAATLRDLGPNWVLTYFTDAPPQAYFYPIGCSDCTQYGTNQRPAYWE